MYFKLQVYCVFPQMCTLLVVPALMVGMVNAVNCRVPVVITVSDVNTNVNAMIAIVNVTLLQDGATACQVG